MVGWIPSKTDMSDLHGYEIHRPSIQGTKLLLKMIRAIIVIMMLVRQRSRGSDHVMSYRGFGLFSCIERAASGDTFSRYRDSRWAYGKQQPARCLHKIDWCRFYHFVRLRNSLVVLCSNEMYICVLDFWNLCRHQDPIACAPLVFKNRLLGLVNFPGGKMLTFSQILIFSYSPFRLV